MPSSGFPRGGHGGLLGLSVGLEGAGQRELAQAVTHHVLGDVHRDELPAVVDSQGVADELWHDGGATRPGLEYLLLALPIELLHPLLQPLLDVWPLPR